MMLEYVHLGLYNAEAVIVTRDWAPPPIAREEHYLAIALL
jgi:hypothetical protein